MEQGAKCGGSYNRVLTVGMKRPRETPIQISVARSFILVPEGVSSNEWSVHRAGFELSEEPVL